MKSPTREFLRAWSLLLLAALAGFACPADAGEQPDPGYVVARDGHLFLGEQRIRFWGFNMQSSPFTSYAAIDHLVDRFAQFGLNAARVWPTGETFYSDESVAAMRLRDSRKGDGGALDRYDYLVARLGQHGMYIENPALHYVNIAAIRKWPDAEIQSVLATDSSDGAIRKLHAIAPYVLDGWEAMVTQHIRNYLSHRNPYTGRTYADEPAFLGWELANESQFVYCLVDRNCLQSLPVPLKDRIAARWVAYAAAKGAHADGVLPVFDPDWDHTTSNPTHVLFRRFVYERFVEVSRRFEAAARAMGTAGRGIAVQPITFSTQAGAPLLLARAAYGAGDFSTIGSYQTPMTEEEGSEFFPFALHLGKRTPLFYNFNYGAIAGKPTVVYEASFFRPDPYRAEWPWALLHLALTQDWDGAFFYSYGQPNVIYQDRGGTPFYGALALPEPGGQGRGAHDLYYGLHHGGDEVAVGAWVAAGGVFLSRNATGSTAAAYDASRQAQVFDFGADSVFGPAPGYCGVACRRPGDSMVPRLNQVSVAQALRLRLDDTPGSAAAPVASADPPSRLDGEATRLLIDGANCSAVAGKLSGAVAFSSGVRLSFAKEAFGFVSLQSLDGRPIKESRKLLLMAQGRSQNSGFQLDTHKASKGGTVGAMAGVLSPGEAPIVFERPGFRAEIPGGLGEVLRQDFNLSTYAQSPPGGDFAVGPAEPFFRAVLTR